MVFKKCHNLHLVERWKWIKGQSLPPHSSLKLQWIKKLQCKTLKTGHTYSMWTQLNYRYIHTAPEQGMWWDIAMIHSSLLEGIQSVSSEQSPDCHWEQLRQQTQTATLVTAPSGLMRWRLVTCLHKNMAFTVQWLQVLIQSPFIFRG